MNKKFLGIRHFTLIFQVRKLTLIDFAFGILYKGVYKSGQQECPLVNPAFDSVLFTHFIQVLREMKYPLISSW